MEIDPNVELLLHDERVMYTSAQDVTLIPDAVDLSCIKWINVLPTRTADGRYKSGIRIYRQISSEAKARYPWPNDRIK